MNKSITAPAQIVKPTIPLGGYPCSQELLGVIFTLAVNLGWLQATIEQNARQFEEVLRHA